MGGPSSSTVAENLGSRFSMKLWTPSLQSLLEVSSKARNAQEIHVLVGKHVIQDRTVKQMGLLDSRLASPHEFAVHETREDTGLFSNVCGKLQCSLQNTRLLGYDFLEQTAEMLGISSIDVSGGQEIEGIGVADQARQEER